MSKTKLPGNSNDEKEIRQLEECFIITPIGSPDSEIFKKTTGLLEAIIQPVLSKLGFKAIPAHQIASPGSIPKQILRHIVEDRLVLANLTGLNPNVMYELAVRHAVKLPLVMLAEVGTDLPFDVKDQRTIFYSDTFAGVEACKKHLESAILTVLAEGYEAENPIYDAIETNTIIKNIDPESKEEYLVNRLDKIEATLGQLLHNRNRDSHPKIWLGDIHTETNNWLMQINVQSSASVSKIVEEITSIIEPLGVDFKIMSDGSRILRCRIMNVSEKTQQMLGNSIAKLAMVKDVKVTLAV